MAVDLERACIAMARARALAPPAWSVADSTTTEGSVAVALEWMPLMAREITALRLEVAHLRLLTTAGGAR